MRYTQELMTHRPQISDAPTAAEADHDRIYSYFGVPLSGLSARIVQSRDTDPEQGALALLSNGRTSSAMALLPKSVFGAPCMLLDAR